MRKAAHILTEQVAVSTGKHQWRLTHLMYTHKYLGSRVYQPRKKGTKKEKGLTVHTG